jgi:cardiolipin synthase
MAAPTMTTANKVTIVRILLIPFFVLAVLLYRRNGDEWDRYLAVISFAVAAICDGVDGFIARHYNQRSELGAILDPLADKLLLVSAIVLFTLENTHLGRIPFWFPWIVIGRDVMLLIGLLVIQMTVGKVRVRPRMTGKVATVLQMLCVVWVLLKWDANVRFVSALFPLWTYGAAIFTGVSGLLYVFDGIKQLSAHPASLPSAKQ